MTALELYRAKWHAASLCAALLLFGCATTGASHTTVEAIGRITEKTFAEARAGDPGAYRPGQGGAVGGAIAGILIGLNGTPAHTKYVVKQNDGAERLVPSTQDIAVGTCVAVMVDSANKGHWYLKLGEATLAPSDACP